MHKFNLKNPNKILSYPAHKIKQKLFYSFNNYIYNVDCSANKL